MSARSVSASEPARFSLRHPRGTTKIVSGTGALAAATPELAAWVAGRGLFVLSTSRVRSLHGRSLEPVRGAATRCVELEVPEGEAAKTLEHAGRLWREMVAAGGRRDSRLLAFGGGSVGDLGGFVAGCFLRGIEVAQAPTTLLAQVDAAIGGKTAIDLPEAKNSIGLFHHPAFVVADSAWLATLPEAELRCGLVEAIKMAGLLDPDLFATLERDLDRLLAGELAALGPVAAAAGRVKAAVVERDPEERGERKLLNFGHTLGHALETAAGYAGLRHGDAVAHGLLFALQLATARGWAAELTPRMRALIGRLAPPPLPPLAIEEICRAMARDKKAMATGLGWVLPERLGSGRWDVEVSFEEARRALAEYLVTFGEVP
jgi:3-dehydroquinate synthase